MEIGALFAPKPMLLVSCTGDWTVNTPTVEYPAISSVYKLQGAPDRLAWMQQNAEHNYNQKSRESVYGFFSRWIDGRGDGKPVPEPAFMVDKPEDLRVFPDGKLPPEAKAVSDLVAYWKEQSEKQLQSARPTSKKKLQEFRESYGQALRLALAVPPFIPEIVSQGNVDRFTIGRTGMGDAISARLVTRSRKAQNRSAVIVLAPASAKDSLELSPFSTSDLLFIEVFQSGGSSPPRNSARYFHTYNRSDTAEQVQDILTAAAYLKRAKQYGNVQLYGVADFGPVALLAFAVAGEFDNLIDAATIDWNGLDPTDDRMLDRYFTPSLRRAGDFRTALALGAPRPLTLYGYNSKLDVSLGRQAYRALNARSKLVVAKENTR